MRCVFVWCVLHCVQELHTVRMAVIPDKPERRYAFEVAVLTTADDDGRFNMLLVSCLLVLRSAYCLRSDWLGGCTHMGAGVCFAGHDGAGRGQQGCGSAAGQALARTWAIGVTKETWYTKS